MNTAITAKDEERFWSRVEKTDTCWIWTGSAHKTRGGYGYFRFGGKRTSVHRFSYLLHYKKDPGALYVLHRCDNPPCVNPEHLFLGTFNDNMKDMVRKRRSPLGDRNGSRKHPEKHPKGENHYRAKITEEDVREIRRAAKAGVAQKLLAEHYRLNRGTICQIVHRQRWKHVRD